MVLWPKLKISSHRRRICFEIGIRLRHLDWRLRCAIIGGSLIEEERALDLLREREVLVAAIDPIHRGGPLRSQIIRLGDEWSQSRTSESFAEAWSEVFTVRKKPSMKLRLRKPIKNSSGGFPISPKIFFRA